ncbi:MAG: lysophospholipid acyltransferase family protein [bacterium]
MESLTSENTYRSPKKKTFFAWRMMPGLGFYSKMISITLKSSRLAKRGTYDGEQWVHSSMGMLRALESVGARFEVENIDIIRCLGAPCVFVGNHMSTLETFVLPCIIQPVCPVTFIVKQSLVEYPVFKHVMISRDPIVVNRTNPREDLKAVLEGGKERLNNGISIIVFPQTTRRVHRTIEKFNTIGVKLAKYASVPIVPFALRTDAWENGKRIKDFGKIDPTRPIHICFGEPIRVKGNGKEEHEIIVRFISEKLKEWFLE